MIAVDDPTIVPDQVPAPPTATDDTARATFITHSQMREYQQRGLATPLSKIITDFVRYDCQWWIADHHGWHLIDDQHLIARLDNHSRWAGGGLYLGGVEPGPTNPSTP